MKTMTLLGRLVVLVSILIFCGRAVGSGSTNILSVCDEPSLRTAIGFGGWVSITCNGTVTLTNTIIVTNDVTLDATGVSFAISGNNSSRIFYVMSGASLAATNLTLTDGRYTNLTVVTNAAGGAIYNDHGAINFVGCTLTNNRALSPVPGGLAYGGAIYNDGGTVNLLRSGLFKNQAFGGGIGNFHDPYMPTNLIALSFGGAIYGSGGIITIIDCNLVGNFCTNFLQPDYLNTETGFVMGGAIYQQSGALMITNTQFVLNQALGGKGPPGGAFKGFASPAFGGALAIVAGTLSIDRCVFWSNQAIGGAADENGILSSGPGGSAQGGAIYSAAVWDCSESSFYANSADTRTGNSHAAPGCGGGIYNAGTLGLVRCSIYSNFARGATGILFDGGLPTQGGPGLGGGIFNGGYLAATNCTVVLNSAIAGSGSPYAPNNIGTNGNAIGGGIFTTNGAVTILVNVTVASNSCAAAGPGFAATNGFSAGAQIGNTNGTLGLLNCLLAYGDTNANAYGTITDDGHNLSSDASPNFSAVGSQNNTDPQLGPLANYGGSTWTQALAYGSPAIDAGDSSGAPPTDQRGAIRPHGAASDIGAYEFYSNQIDVPALSLTSVTNSVVLNFSGYPGGLYHLLISSNLVSWTDAGTFGPYVNPTSVSQTVSSPGANVSFFRLQLP